MVNSVFVEAFVEVFKPLGFRKKSANFYRVSGDLYCVVGLQGSSWDESCYVNVGFAPAEKAKAGWLPESQCLVRFRADAIASISDDELKLLSREVTEGGKESEFRVSLVERIAVPVALTVGSIGALEDLKSLLQSGISGQVFIHREIRDVLLDSE
ncbi:DUF4304 domain-containing protein [Streptomyces lushanensis]|uniref:DUF4304 domain-containing protein n=1 Tax=Streptomyces lushanensis TaxID=1434255 RepID=UPI000832EA79|nr:DUF4304 domain-containing protein [Streptomyces lushanensis]